MVKDEQNEKDLKGLIYFIYFFYRLSVLQIVKVLVLNICFTLDAGSSCLSRDRRETSAVLKTECAGLPLQGRPSLGITQLILHWYMLYGFQIHSAEPSLACVFLTCSGLLQSEYLLYLWCSIAQTLNICRYAKSGVATVQQRNFQV